MGLLDGILGDVMGSVMGGSKTEQSQNPLGGVLSGLAGGNATQGGNLLAAAMGMLQQNGGLPAVLDKFRGAGLAGQADSWVSTGPNAAVSADQLQQIFGASALGNVASQLGMTSNQAGSAMARILPELINQLTPEGTIPEDHSDLLAKGQAMLRGGSA